MRLRFIEPQLPSLVDQPPEGNHWIHEIKHDGYRCQVLVERGEARVFTRNGYDWTDRYPSLVRAAMKLNCRSAILDGEAVVQDGNCSTCAAPYFTGRPCENRVPIKRRSRKGRRHGCGPDRFTSSLLPPPFSGLRMGLRSE